MRALLPALVCLVVCSGHVGRERKTHQREEDARNPLKALAILLSSCNPKCAFSLGGACSAVPNPTSDTLIERLNLPLMQAEAMSKEQHISAKAQQQLHSEAPTALQMEVEPDMRTSEQETEAAKDIHIGVIGAGPLGMAAAAVAKDRGYRVTVLEKQADVGGDWRRWGNPWSKLQVHRDAYLLRCPNGIHVEGQEQLPLYPYRDQMLDYFQRYAKQTGIYDDVIFNATVTGRKGTKLFYEKCGEQKSLTFSHIYAAPGRVNARSEMDFDSESIFQGEIARGSGGDLIGVNLQGKNIAIVGQGSFAIENARHALEAGAEQVVMIARHEPLVYPRVVSYAMDCRCMRSEYIMESIQPMYATAGYSYSEILQIGSPPFTILPPTSDFFFLAMAAGKLKVVRGEVAKLQTNSVLTNEGDVFPADVFIKCLGFKRDTKLDAELIQPGSGNMEERWIQTFVDDNNTVFLGSALNRAPGYTNTIPSCQEADEFWRSVDGNPVEVDFGEWQEPLEFFEELEKEWSDYCALFGVDIPYPYTEFDIRRDFVLD